MSSSGPTQRSQRLLLRKDQTARRANAAGVRLASGEELRADNVIVNADPMYSYPALIPTRYQDRGLVRRMRELEPSCSGFVILLGVKGDYPELAHHNVFFSEITRPSSKLSSKTAHLHPTPLST